MQSDDTELLRLLADPATQRQAFGKLVSIYSEPLYRQIRRMVLNHDDANDVLQNTFIKAWQGLATFEGRSKLSSWLYRIAVNEALDFIRKRKDMTSLSGDDDFSQSVSQRLMADDFFDGDETEALLHDAVSKLPEVQKMVFQMRYFEGMKYKEISDILKTSEGALKASYHIAVKKISEFFDSVD